MRFPGILHWKAFTKSCMLRSPSDNTNVSIKAKKYIFFYKFESLGPGQLCNNDLLTVQEVTVTCVDNTNVYPPPLELLFN